MADKRVRATLNDGFLIYGEKETERSARGKRVGETFKQMGELAFRMMSLREEDYLYAQATSSVLSLKVCTLYPPNLRSVNKNKLKVIIRNVEYDVIKVDADPGGYYLFFMLQEVGTYEQNKVEDESTD